MQLKNDHQGLDLLRDTILDHFNIEKGRVAVCFLESRNEEWGRHYQHYLIDRIHVFRYSIGEDRGLITGALELAIGPHYFSPEYFWSYENARRFRMEASTEAVQLNLRLLEEFLSQSRVAAT
jgi:hypothetical protein